jgi:hypothetical protein
MLSHPKAGSRRADRLRRPVLFKKGEMPRVEQGLDRLHARTCPHLAIKKPGLMISCGIHVGMGREATHPTAKRLLIGTISITAQS